MKPVYNLQTTAALDAIVASPAGSYVFAGPEGVGRTTAAVWLAVRLNCLKSACGSCYACKAIAAGNHPDFINIVPDGKSISIAQIHELQTSLELKPYYAEGCRVVCVDKADLLTTEAQNALLKVLEEPPPQTIFVLIAENLNSLLPTVRSRLKTIYFAPLPPAEAAKALVSAGIPGPLAKTAADAAKGYVALAINLANEPDKLNAQEGDLKSGRQLIEADMFDRLIEAQRLADAGQAQGLLEVLAGVVRADLRRSAETKDQPAVDAASHRLRAIARTRQYLTSNVNARAALEGLMLEL